MFKYFYFVENNHNKLYKMYGIFFKHSTVIYLYNITVCVTDDEDAVPTHG